MKSKIAAVVFSVAFIFAGCSKPGPSTGTVTKKSYDDPDTYMEYYPGIHIPGSCSGGYNNQPRICTSGIDIPGHWKQEHDGPHWYLYLVSPDDNDDGKPDHKGWREVDETTYHRCQINEFCDTKA